MRIGISAMWLSSEASASNSGLSRYAYNLIQEMSRQAPQHQFVVFAPSTFVRPTDWGGNIDLVPVEVPDLLKRVRWEHFAPRKLSVEHKLDLWFSAAQATPLGMKIPTVVMVHDVIPVLFPEHHVKRTVIYYRWAFRYTAKNATLVLANSECTKRDFVKMFGAKAEKVVVTPLGPGNTSTAAEPGAFEKLGINEPFLFTLGNLEWRKNLHGLLEAFAVIASREKDLTLVIGGAKRATSEDFLGEQISRLGLGDRVKVLGYVPDGALPELFSRSSAFVFPSFYEGFGLPVLEAMLNSAVLACTDRSSVPEVAGDDAFYFDPGSKESMVEAISLAIKAEDRGARIWRGLERAQTFTWERTARETLAALESLA